MSFKFFEYIVGSASGTGEEENDPDRPAEDIPPPPPGLNVVSFRGAKFVDWQRLGC